MQTIKTVTPDELKRLAVDAVVGDVNNAVDKLMFLNNLLYDDYIGFDEGDSCMEEFQYKNMAIIHMMMCDYINDIHDFMDALADEFEL